MSLIIGLTGGIGSGKSTVSSLFSELGVHIVDADIIAREVVQKGTPALKKIEEHFGSQILLEGALNRKRLRELVFKCDTEKNWLNDLLHPLIHTEMLLQLESQSEAEAYQLFEAPLLFENKLEHFCDYILVVDIDEQVQLSRASRRDGVMVESIKAIMKSQVTREYRQQHANFIIDNSDVSFEDLKDKVDQLHLKFIELAKN
jgi:dephospho-CoA kinase